MCITGLLFLETNRMEDNSPTFIRDQPQWIVYGSSPHQTNTLLGKLKDAFIQVVFNSLSSRLKNMTIGPFSGLNHVYWIVK